MTELCIYIFFFLTHLKFVLKKKKKKRCLKRLHCTVPVVGIGNLASFRTGLRIEKA